MSELDLLEVHLRILGSRLAKLTKKIGGSHARWLKDFGPLYCMHEQAIFCNKWKSFINPSSPMILVAVMKGTKFPILLFVQPVDVFNMKSTIKHLHKCIVLSL